MANPLNVLYLGMADDIMAPLLMFPDLDNLFVIDLFDLAFSPDRTWQGQRDDIKKILINGGEKGSHSEKIYKSINRSPIDGDPTPPRSVHNLMGPSQITSETEDAEVWKLNFAYLEKPRQLVFYKNRNFLTEWPKEIVGLSHVLGIGSFSFSKTFARENSALIPLFVKMLEERTLDMFSFYALAFNHNAYPEKLLVYNGRERNGSRVAKVTVSDKKNPLWYQSLRDDEALRKK